MRYTTAPTVVTVATAAAAGSTTLTTAAADVGVEVDVDGPATVAVDGVFDFNVSAAGVGVCIGELLVDGVAETAQALFRPTDADRATVAQAWTVTVAAGPHTLKLQAHKTINAGVADVTVDHTVLRAVQIRDVP